MATLDDDARLLSLLTSLKVHLFHYPKIECPVNPHFIVVHSTRCFQQAVLRHAMHGTEDGAGGRMTSEMRGLDDGRYPIVYLQINQ